VTRYYSGNIKMVEENFALAFRTNFFYYIIIGNIFYGCSQIQCVGLWGFFYPEINCTPVHPLVGRYVYGGSLRSSAPVHQAVHHAVHHAVFTVRVYNLNECADGVDIVVYRTKKHGIVTV
jgi:hypothetical protein